MMDSPTHQDLYRIAVAAMVNTPGSRVRRAVVMREGTNANIQAAAAAAVGDDLSAEIVRVGCHHYLSTSRGLALDRLAFDAFFGTLRKPAAPAWGTVQFTLATPAVSSFTIPANTQVATAQGVTFVTVAAVTFPAGSSGPVGARVRSVLAGSAQQAAEGTITSILSSVPSAPAGLAVNNAEATAGADEEEDDDALVARCQLVDESLRRGTVPAIAAFVAAYPGVRSVYVHEQRDRLGDLLGPVEAWVTDAYTDALRRLASTPPAYAVQAQAFARAIQDALYDVRAAGVEVKVRVSRVVLQQLVLALAFEADNEDTEGTALRARATAAATVNQLRPGATLDPSAITAALRGVPGLVVTGREVLQPAGLVVPRSLEVLRAPLAMVSTTTAGA